MFNKQFVCVPVKPALTQYNRGMSSMTKSFLKVFGASGLLAMIASQSFAQDAPALVPTDSVFILNSLLFLIGGFLVFWMAAGFTMLEAGLVQKT